MNYAILGAGVSGLSAARKLVDAGETVTVFEKDAKVGGLAKTRIVDGFVYDPHGGHIFNSKHQEVVDWVFSIVPKDKWQFNVRNAKIYFNGKFVSYPFELSLCELDPEDELDCAYDYLMAKQGPEPDNFKDWLTWNFGEGIASRYMIPYNTKIWAYPLEDMETGWMRGKMPLPEKKEMLRSLLLKDPTERKMPHSTFYYPIEGGIQTMVDAIAAPLDVKLNHEVKEIENRSDGWFIDDEGPFDRLIITIPLPVVAHAMALPADVIDAISLLKYNSLNTLLFDCPPTDISWLYIPSAKYSAHRIGYQSALTPKATPHGEGSGALEVIGEKRDIDEAALHSGKIIPNDLEPGHVLDHEFTEYAYVIHDMNYQKATDLIRGYFGQQDNVYLTGRWALWNYKNMDLCMKDSFELVKKITKGAK